ncbi:MDR family MFS transporter [Martelella sp. AD-3]|uniref:MDR family MFS transporter n=1 Tax=Martelella sp. AD-3 TaxID=686597 RepID=UPI000467B5D9|nr:MDR family MFS transporter [Martelella sp. AD-3]AMM85802.1 MFS transporter [Martelella sp. AD-3]
MTTQTSSPPQPFISLVEHPRLRIVAFLFLLMAMFLATLDNQIVSTALPTIVGEFGAVERFGWVASAYLLASCAVMPLYGKLGDLIGRKYVLMTAIVIFLVGSLTCGLAVSMNTLIAARALQGFGGGGLMVSIFALNADLFSPRERPKYQSYASLVIMTSGALGPLLGGTMTAAFGWRSIFLINLPLALIVLCGLFFLLPNRKPDRQPKIDFAGAALLAVAVTAVVLWSDSSEIFGSLIAPWSLGVVGVAVVCGLAFVLAERRAPEPIIPLSLLANPTVSLLIFISIASGAVAIGMVNYLALYLQTVYGLSPTTAGLFFIPITSGIVIGSISSGRLMSMTGRYKPYAIMGLALSTLCFTLLALYSREAPLYAVAVIMGLQGIGVGLGQQVPVLGVQNAARGGDVGAATGTVTLSRMIGAATAISIYGALLARGLSQAPPVPGAGPLADLTPVAIHDLTGAAHAAAIAGYADTFSAIFTFAACLAFAGLLAAMSLKPIALGAARHGPGTVKSPA